MFERFTDRARRVVVLSQEEARRLGHNYIGTEHLLLGLVHEGEGVAARALVSLGISLDETRRRVEEIIGRGEGMVPGHIPFTPRAKAVLELSLREALSLGHNYIGTEHILLGLIREGEGVAAQVLVTLGAPLPVVRARVVDLLAGVAPATGATGPVVGGTRVMARLAARGSAGAGARGDEMLERSIDRIVFRRFTVSSSRALMLAESEAMRLGHPLVGVADLLLGLALEGEGGAARALGGVGVDLDGARAAAEQVLGAGRGARGSVDGYDDDLLDAIERALVEAVGAGRVSDDDSAQAGDAGDAGDPGREAGDAGDEAGGAEGEAGGEAGHAGGGAGDAAVDSEGGGAVGRGAGEGHEPDRPAAGPDRPAAPAPPDEKIDTEELLLGLVAQAERRSGVAAQMLTALGTTPAAVRRAVGDLPGRAPAEPGHHPSDQGVPGADAGNESGAGPGVDSSGP